MYTKIPAKSGDRRRPELTLHRREQVVICRRDRHRARASLLRDHCASACARARVERLTSERVSQRSVRISTSVACAQRPRALLRLGQAAHHGAREGGAQHGSAGDDGSLLRVARGSRERRRRDRGGRHLGGRHLGRRHLGRGKLRAGGWPGTHCQHSVWMRGAYKRASASATDAGDACCCAPWAARAP